jgi:hypothetical protein
MSTTTRTDVSGLADLLAGLSGAAPAVCSPSHVSELTAAEVVEVAELLGIDFAIAPFSLEELQQGLEIELDLEMEVDCVPSVDDWLEDDLVELGKVAVSHLREQTDYYTWLSQAHAPGDPMPPQYAHADVGTD